MMDPPWFWNPGAESTEARNRAPVAPQNGEQIFKKKVFYILEGTKL